MVPRKRGLLMTIFGGLDAKTITMLLMALLGLAGSGTALKRGSDTDEQVAAVQSIAVSSIEADSIRDAKIIHLEEEVERLKAKLGQASVERRELVRLRTRAEKRPWWRIW